MAQALRALVRPLTLAAAAAFALAAAGCQQAPPPRFPPLSFKGQPPIALDVRSVDVRDNYAPPLRAPNVEHEMPVSPAAAVRQWTLDRMQPVGAGDTATLTIQKASVIEQPLPKEGGLAALAEQQGSKLVGTIEALVTIRDPSGSPKATTTARVGRTATLGDRMSLNERDEAYYAFVKDLMRTFDQQMTDNINAYLPGYIR